LIGFDQANRFISEELYVKLNKKAQHF